MHNIEKAIQIATEAHRGQVRKDGVTPYIVHPLGVAEIVRRQGGDHDQYVAAILHDTIEDTYIDYDMLLAQFGSDIANMVSDLTNIYTKEAFPLLNRAERKQLENERLSRIPDRVKLIKLADVDYNTSDVDCLSTREAKMQLREKLAMTEHIQDGNRQYAAFIMLKITGKLNRLEEREV